MLARCSEITLRPAAATDDLYLRRIFSLSRPDLALLPPDVRDALIDMQYQAQRTGYAHSYPAAEHHVLVADVTDVGVLVLDRSDDAVRVVDITVDLPHRRRGVATAALREVIDGAGGRPVRLVVWSENVAARALYERLGFTATGAQTIEGYVAMERSAE